MKVPPFAKSTTAKNPTKPAATAAPADDTPRETPPVTTQPSAQAPECAKEQEPNNGADQATTFEKCISGELTGWTDTDSLQVVAPDDAVNMVIDHIEQRGKIQYTVTMGGGGQQNFNMSFTDQAPKTKVTPGKTYIFNLKWDNNGQGAVTDVRPYAIRVAWEN